ncbi:MAG TPA: VWA domain-containing protein, partial [Myxococcota bacterium]|nr:VWA domain-containing protein [Myxococcota bacterium]
LTARAFAPGDEAEALRRFRRQAPAALPHRQSYRREASRRGDAWNIRRSMREAVKRDGEMLSLPKLRRKLDQRRILLLIDVSGSMKDQSDGNLRFAHAMARVSDRLEVFTVGTRLTRVTRAMRLINRDQALAAAAGAVADWDGGTRIGDALHAFLSVPRGVLPPAATWYVILCTAGMLVFAPLALRHVPPRALVAQARREWRMALLAAAVGFAGYGLILHALRTAPVSYVVAVRQASVLFAVALGALRLRERPTRLRLAGALATVVGVALVAVS